LVADDGPSQADDLSLSDKAKADSAPPKPAASPAAHADCIYGSICLQIVRAFNAPKTVLGGKPDAYVSVKYASYAGASSVRTSAVESDCNPEWHEDLVFRERLACDRALVEDKDIVLALNDGSASSMMDGDPLVAVASLKLKDVLATPGEFQLEMGKGCSLVVKAHFEESKAEPLAAVGSDWLNGLVRKGWHVFCKAIDTKMRVEVNKALYDIAHPEPDADSGKVKGLPGIKDLVLDRFSIGGEPPFFLELKLLNTRCVQDVQLSARLRWVCGSGMIIRVKAKGNPGVPDVVIEIRYVCVPATVGMYSMRQAACGCQLTVCLPTATSRSTFLLGSKYAWREEEPGWGRTAWSWRQWRRRTSRCASTSRQECCPWGCRRLPSTSSSRMP
jgi:hypothetical protein